MILGYINKTDLTKKNASYLTIIETVSEISLIVLQFDLLNNFPKAQQHHSDLLCLACYEHNGALSYTQHKSVHSAAQVYLFPT